MDLSDDVVFKIYNDGETRVVDMLVVDNVSADNVDVNGACVLENVGASNLFDNCKSVSIEDENENISFDIDGDNKSDQLINISSDNDINMWKAYFGRMLHDVPPSSARSGMLLERPTSPLSLRKKRTS
ncbi:hypothetical protein Tco_0016143 [Tanacetum coccineum]